MRHFSIAPLCPALLVLGLMSALAPAVRAEPPQPALVTVDGMGWLQIGMSESDLLKHFDPAPSNEAHGKWWRQCHLWRSQSWSGLSVIIEDGELARLAIRRAEGRGAEQALALKTEAGIGLGATEAELRAAYSELHQEAGREGGADRFSVDLYYLPRGLAGRGLRFSLDASRRVNASYAGGPQNGYGDNCE